MGGVLYAMLTLHSSVPMQAHFDLQGAAGGAVPFLTFKTKGECKELLPNWSASCGDVQCKGNWRWSADHMC